MKQNGRVRTRMTSVGGDASPSEIQFLGGNGNIHGSGVEVGEELKRGKMQKKKKKSNRHSATT